MYSRSNLPKIKHVAYIINRDGHKLAGTDWITLYVSGSNGSTTYFDSFIVEHIPKEVKRFIGNKNTNIYRILAYNLIVLDSCVFYLLIFC